MTDVNVRVLVADDHPVVRDGLRALLLADPATELVGEAGDGDAAIALALRLRPDVVVMDLQLPGTDGIQATQALTEAVPGVAVLVLTMRADDDALFAALRAGASGYLLKGAAGQDVLAAIHAVRRGEAVFGSGVARRLLRAVRGDEPAVSPPFPATVLKQGSLVEQVGQTTNFTFFYPSAAHRDKTVTVAAEKVRLRKRSSGRMGSCTRRSW